MRKETCYICRHGIKREDVRKHRIVPKVFIELCGIVDSGAITLCINCYNEVSDWYIKRVYGLTYDTGTKGFRYKSPNEMVKEYQSAFDSFVKYKRSANKQI